MRSERVIDRYVDDIVARIGPLKQRLEGGHRLRQWRGRARRRNTCSTGWASTRRTSSARATARSRTIIPIRRSSRTCTTSFARCARERRDLGIAFDGDADRIGVVDGQGEIIWGDHILILYARDVLARTGTGQPIIFDVKCSQALPHAIEAAGGKPIMWKTGHSLIKEKMKQLKAPLAGEMSGHMFFAEGFYGHDDALYGAARLLRIVADCGQERSPNCSRRAEVRLHAGDPRRLP